MISTDTEIPHQWQAISPEKLAGTIIVIGAPDTGKSTLVAWLVGRLGQTHQQIGWLDGDVGQTTSVLDDRVIGRAGQLTSHAANVCVVNVIRDPIGEIA